MSAFLLGVIWPLFPAVLGLPVQLLHLLAVFPALFFCFDLFFFRTYARRTPVKWRTIALLNAGYSVISLVLVYLNRSSVTAPGWAYVFGEVLLLIGLSGWQWRLAASSSKGPGPN